ncbi:MAG: aquaporin [Alphaproteobacteria bacterium]|nr:aquaporin [Alphaproteobacteria bacterium]
MKKYYPEFAELVGTFVLVLFGVGSAVLAGDQIGNLGVGLCFGIAVIAMSYAVGKVSGGHFNPAVSAGMWIAGRISLPTFAKYTVAQFIGATIGAAIVLVLARGAVGGYAGNLAANEWTNYTMCAAILFELIATFVFVRVILELTATDNPPAGLAIGLMLAALLMIGMPITNGSLNPARSFGPAIISGDKHALSQLWLFLIVPTIGGTLAGFARRLVPLNGSNPAKKRK